MVETERSGGAGGLSDEALAKLEHAHPRGLSVQQVIDAFGAAGLSLTEATFRKYVPLGLLPRSVRVGRKGKSRGSQGLYPATVVRRVDAIRRLMGQGFTIEQIQNEFYFARVELEELDRCLERLYSGLERALASRGGDDLATRKLVEARELGAELRKRLDEIEQRMSMRARMSRASV